MRVIDQYLEELNGELRVRGPARRRMLRECRDHLLEASAGHGPEEAVRRFGPADELAAAFDLEVAARWALVSTAASVVGVLGVGGSTLALVNASSSAAPAVLVWSVVFFAAAQTAAVSALLGALQASATRTQAATAPDVALLCRRNLCALFFAAVTMFAAGAAVPGQGSALLILGGPALGALATAPVLATRALVRRRGPRAQCTIRSPLRDLGALVRVPVTELGPSGLLLAGASGAAVAAFVRDRGEHASVFSASETAAVESLLVVLGFLALGPVLGLRPNRHHLVTRRRGR